MDDFQVRSIIEPIDTPNNKLYIKHSYNKGDEKKARIDHSSTHALLEGKERGEKDKKGRGMTAFSFLSGIAFRNLCTFNTEKEQRAASLLWQKKETARRKQESFCLVSAQTHTDGHYLMTRKWDSCVSYREHLSERFFI